MNTVRFIKPFSRGQITLPTAYRKALGIEDTTWLKVELQGSKIIIDSVKDMHSLSLQKKAIPSRVSHAAYRKRLKKITDGWYSKTEEKSSRKSLSARNKYYE